MIFTRTVFYNLPEIYFSYTLSLMCLDYQGLRCSQPPSPSPLDCFSYPFTLSHTHTHIHVVRRTRCCALDHEGGIMCLLLCAVHHAAPQTQKIACPNGAHRFTRLRLMEYCVFVCVCAATMLAYVCRERLGSFSAQIFIMTQCMV